MKQTLPTKYSLREFPLTDELRLYLSDGHPSQLTIRAVCPPDFAAVQMRRTAGGACFLSVAEPNGFHVVSDGIRQGLITAARWNCAGGYCTLGFDIAPPNLALVQQCLPLCGVAVTLRIPVDGKNNPQAGALLHEVVLTPNNPQSTETPVSTTQTGMENK